MKFINPLPFVRDIHRARHFYAKILGVPVVQDHDDFVQFQGGFALHDGVALFATVFGSLPGQEEPFGRENLVLYFEDENLDSSFERVSGKVDVIHGIRNETWGQRVFRIRDPDGHIVEIGEPQ